MSSVATAPAAERKTAAPPATAARRTSFVGLLLLLALLLRLGVALRPLGEVDDLAIPDDAYLSLTIARNIAAGHGPRYGTAPTNGFQPLYVFLTAPFFRIWPADHEAPVRAALVLLVVCDVIGLALLLRLVRRVSASRAAPLAAAAVWACDPYAIATSVNGLETSLAFLFLAGALDRSARGRLEAGLARRPSHAIALGAWLGLAALARLDSLILAPIALLGLALDARRSGAPFSGMAKAAVTSAGVLATILAPWLAYSFASTRSLLPISGQAVRFMELSTVGHQPTFANHWGPMLERAAGVVLRKNVIRIGVALALVALVPFAIGRQGWRAMRERLGVHADAMAFAALLLAAYVLVVFGHWHFARYFYPVALALTLLVAALVDLHARSASRPGAAIATAAVLALVIGSALLPAFARLYGPVHGTWGYRRIGLWAAGRFPPGSVIGGSQTGALGYFADRLTVVNLDGVVNRACYDSMRAGRAWDYVLGEKVAWLVWQDDIDFLARESSRGRTPRLGPPERVPGITTWGAPWELWSVPPVEAAVDRPPS